MNPVRGRAMLNFIHWVAIHHPEIERLRDQPEDDLLRLVDEFEGGKLRSNSTLKRKWEVGFHTLFKTNNDWEGYDIARSELNKMESRDS